MRMGRTAAAKPSAWTESSAFAIAVLVGMALSVRVVAEVPVQLHWETPLGLVDEGTTSARVAVAVATFEPPAWLGGTAFEVDCSNGGNLAGVTLAGVRGLPLDEGRWSSPEASLLPTRNNETRRVAVALGRRNKVTIALRAHSCRLVSLAGRTPPDGTADLCELSNTLTLFYRPAVSLYLSPDAPDDVRVALESGAETSVPEFPLRLSLGSYVVGFTRPQDVIALVGAAFTSAMVPIGTPAVPPSDGGSGVLASSIFRDSDGSIIGGVDADIDATLGIGGSEATAGWLRYDVNVTVGRETTNTAQLMSGLTSHEPPIAASAASRARLLVFNYRPIVSLHWEDGVADGAVSSNTDVAVVAQFATQVTTVGLRDFVIAGGVPYLFQLLDGSPWSAGYSARIDLGRTGVVTSAYIKRSSRAIFPPNEESNVLTRFYANSVAIELYALRWASSPFPDPVLLEEELVRHAPNLAFEDAQDAGTAMVGRRLAGSITPTLTEAPTGRIPASFTSSLRYFRMTVRLGTPTANFSFDAMVHLDGLVRASPVTPIVGAEAETEWETILVVDTLAAETNLTRAVPDGSAAGTLGSTFGARAGGSGVVSAHVPARGVFEPGSGDVFPPLADSGRIVVRHVPMVWLSFSHSLVTGDSTARTFVRVFATFSSPVSGVQLEDFVITPTAPGEVHASNVTAEAPEAGGFNRYGIDLDISNATEFRVEFLRDSGAVRPPNAEADAISLTYSELVGTSCSCSKPCAMADNVTAA